MNKKRISFALAAFMTAAVALSGCQGGGGDTTKSSVDLGDSYPLKGDVELSYWISSDFYALAEGGKDGNTPFLQELKKQTGVTVHYQSPPAGQAAEAFNLMIASGDMPDIVQHGWPGFPGGGPEKAISENNIIVLNDMLDNYAPDFKKYLQDNPEIDKMVKTDSGNYYMFPSVREDPKSGAYHGPIIRKDWLDDLGLQEPETISEWHNVLTRFKNEKGATAPLSFQTVSITKGVLIGAFGTKMDIYVDDDGKVKYGPAEPQFKDFIVEMKKWYDEGLLDKNLAVVDNATLDSNVLNGRTGLTIANSASGLKKWSDAMKEKDPKFQLVAIKNPSLEKGKMPKFGFKSAVLNSAMSSAITSSCKNVEAAARFLNYGYTEKGKLLYNYGLENESYTMVDGKPKYTDLITNNPEGKSFSDMVPYYFNTAGGPFEIMSSTIDANTPDQVDAMEKWNQTTEEKYALPPVTPTVDESMKLQSVQKDISTYTSEMVYKFIMGVEPMENYDTYLQTLESLGLQTLLEVNQAAYGRYLER